ncbi:MAG TPA: PDZ domain-containing protein [Longimicrobium sp.]|nr:PDZ domain-containing protein [Longimicrobium sp.]
MGIAKKVAFTAALLALPGASAGQACGRDGGLTVPDLGWDDIRCQHCNINISRRHVRYEFATEPRLAGISGPGEGRLREGDVLVAVDGHLITTDEAGDRLSAVRRGDRVRLTVRRAGRTQNVDVVAGERCLEPPVPPIPPQPPRPPRTPAAPRPPLPPEPPAPPRASDLGPLPAHPPLPPQAPRAPRPPLPPTPPLPPLPPPPPEILPAGWFGFGISCDDCGVRRNDDDVSMYFTEPPVVENVEPGSPAQRAGLRRGDRLTHVDGLALTTRQGARRFAAIRPGQAVTWTYRRGSGAYTARTTAVRRPDAPPTPRTPATPASPRAAQQVRYSGAVGSTDVEVRGAPVTITRDERTGETVIRSHDLTIRLHPNRP